MRILYIYRHPDMGFSIGKVFHPIEEEMRKYAEVDALYLPAANYKFGLFQNIRAATTAVKKKKYDIVHITGAEHYLLPFLKKQNTVVTVHDLGFYTYTSFGLQSIYKYFLWILTLKLADQVTFISEKSKIEALRLVKLKSERISTIHNPVGVEFTYSSKKLNNEKPIILHVGTKTHKNLVRSIKALEGMNCHLRIIGKISPQEIALLNECGIEYSNAYGLTDEEILQEYIKCDIVNFPSLYEGFGMPIIEGNAIGRVVVTSNLQPMQEVAETAAVIVDPYKVNAIKEGYIEAINNSEKYINRGLENAKRFNLERITKQYYNVYKKIL